MVVLYNDTQKLLTFLKTDYTQKSLKPTESLKIDETLILRKPESLKIYSEQEFKKLIDAIVPAKKETKKTVSKANEQKETKTVEKVEVKPEEKVEVKKPRRGRKPKQQTEEGK